MNKTRQRNLIRRQIKIIWKRLKKAQNKEVHKAKLCVFFGMIIKININILYYYKENKYL